MKRTLRARIIAALDKVPLGPAAIADALGVDADAVGQALLQMPDRVRAMGDGRWTRSEPWEKPSAAPPAYARWDPECFPVPATDGGW